jgi:Cd2+/Zn2+-exporting ATPase/Cu+-exporting ATPase
MMAAVVGPEVEVAPPAAPAPPAGEQGGVATADLVRIAAVAAAVVLSRTGVWRPLAPFDFIAIAATLLGGYPVFAEAWENLRARRMTMELSMTIALLAALSIGEFLTALVILFFVLVAEALEKLTVGRGRRAIRDLVDLLPRVVLVRHDGETREAALADVRPGDLVAVRPGERIAVDGTVEAGHSFVDQAAITGESLPVEKVPGASVYAGTINQSGALDVRAQGTGPDTAFGRIVEAVERAERTRAPIQRTAHRLAGYLVYFALACAALTFAVTRDVRATIAVVIVCGACGVAAGTPLAILGAIGRCARQGAIVKGGLHIEALWRVDTVVLDKTGTLTYGEPAVTGVRPCPGFEPNDVVAAAATAERPSEHPLGKAILTYARVRGLESAEPASFAYTPGKGIVAGAGGEEIVVGNRALLEERKIDLAALPAAGRGTSHVLVSRGGRLLGLLEIADVLRPEAARAVQALRGMRLRTLLLTGDAAEVAQAVGAHLGVDRVEAGLLPEQKLARVEQLLERGARVAMVGDGINDAPALMRASVGVAMGSGTDVARESAGVVLLGDDLLKLVDTLRIARRCHRIIRTNFLGTLGVDAIGVALAAAGLLGPLAAALLHVGSELAFLFNSARLLPGRRRAS